MEPKPSLSARLKTMLSEYGAVALAVYFVIFGVTLAGFAVAITTGVEPEGAAGTTGVIASAWVATKLTQPVRILITLVVTPFVAAIKDRLKRSKPSP